MAFATNPNYSKGLTRSLVSYWDFDTVTVDSTGVNPLTNFSGVTSAAGGKPGNYANIVQASNQFLSSTSNSSLQIKTAMTISVWVYFDTVPTGPMAFVAKGSGLGSTSEYSIGYNGIIGQFNSVFGNGASGTSFLNAGSFGAATTGVWYFLVLTVNETTATLYINNTLQAGPSGMGITPQYSGENDFRIGRAATGNSLNGRVDSVGIWHRVLSADEMTTLYNSDNGQSYSSISSSYVTKYGTTANFG